MYIKLLSTSACANITIREIMLINIISSAIWTLQLSVFVVAVLSLLLRGGMGERRGTEGQLAWGTVVLGGQWV